MKFRTKRESDDLDPSEGLAMSVCMYSACVRGGVRFNWECRVCLECSMCEDI